MTLKVVTSLGFSPYFTISPKAVYIEWSCRLVRQEKENRDRRQNRIGQQRIRIEEEEHLRKSLQLSVHLCIYDIVIKVDYCSYNKGEYFVSISHVIILILPKCVKTREPEDKHCVLLCTLYKEQIKHIHDTIPLDKPK